jgi:hypothetical protein
MRQTKAFAGLFMVFLAVLFAACGGDGGTTPTVLATPTPPPPPVTSVIAQGAFAGFAPLTLAFLPFNVSSAGRLDVAVDWTFATNDVDLFVVQGTNPCSPAQFNAGTCPFLAFSMSTTAKPERVTVPSVSAGPYTMYVVNFGTSEEAASYQILLTTNPASSSGDDATTAVRSQRKKPLLRTRLAR